MNVKFKKRFRKIMFLLYILAVVFSVAGTVTTYAGEGEETQQSTPSGWIDFDSSGIYKAKEDAQERDVSMDDPSWIEKQIIKIIKGPGKFLITIQTAFGMNIDQIIYGRISEKSKSINYFSFELASGNIYGNIGTYIYNIFRTISLFILWAIFTTTLVKIMLLTNSGKIRDEFKESLTRMIVIAILMYIMPYLFQLIEFIRDIILYLLQGLATDISMDSVGGNYSTQIRNNFNNTLGGASGGILAVFETLSDKSWFAAVIYDGVSVLSLYYAYQYIGIAMALLIYFIMFPLVCIFAYKDSKLIDSWVKNVIASLLTPVMDAILMMLPGYVFMALCTKGIFICALITFMICMLVIPSRRVISSMLGLNAGGINSIGASAMNAFALIKGAEMLGHGIAGARQHAKNAKEAAKQADMFDELAKTEKNGPSSSADNEDMKQNESVMQSRNRYDENRTQGGGKNTEQLFEDGNEQNDIYRNDESVRGTDDAEADMSDNDMGLQTGMKADYDYTPNADAEYNMSDNEAADAQGNYESYTQGETTSGTTGSGNGNYGSYTGSAGRVNLNTLPGYAQRDYNTAAAAAMGKSGQAKASAQQAKSQAAQFRAHANEHQMVAEASKGKMDSLRQQYGINSKNINDGAIRGQDAYGNNIITGYDKFSPEDNEAFGAAAHAYSTAQNEKVLAQGQAMECDRTADQYTQQSVDYSAAAGQVRAEQAQYDSSMDAQRQAIIEKYANINNMSSPTFSNISYAKRAELMREYAKQEKRRAIVTGVTTTAATIHGAAAGTFMGGRTMMYTAAVGANIGRAVGDGMVSGAYAAANTRAGQTVRRSAGSVVDTLNTPAGAAAAYYNTGYGTPNIPPETRPAVNNEGKNSNLLQFK